MTDRGALTGITVLDLSRLLPGPYCTMILADHGARVIAIEDKRYRADGRYVPILNRNKRHMSLDLETPEGKEIFFKLAKDADMAGGGMNGVIGILLALWARERTGKGQYIDISMTDGMAAFLPIALFFHQLTGECPRRSDTMLSHRYAFYNTYETQDGRHISVGALEPQFWRRLCEKLNVSDLIPLQYDEDRRTELIETFRKIFKSKPLADWEAELEGLDACCEPVRRVGEVLNAPLFRERGMVTEIRERDGRRIFTLGVPVKLSETPGAVRTPSPPAFGESTRDVLLELGYSEHRIRSLAEKKVI